MDKYQKIQKPSILITSLGRTGTKFFQVLLQESFSDCTALHEPDVLNFFQYQGWSNRIRELVKQGKESGFLNLFIRRPLGQWSLIEISDARFQGLLGREEAQRRLENYRKGFISRQPGSIYVEANIGYYGILDLLPKVFDNYRAMYVIRDGKDWVRSHMNWGQMYGKAPLQALFAHRWPTAVDTGEMSTEAWSGLSRFEMLCWAWANLNEFALSAGEADANILVMRFEDIFESPDRYENLSTVLEHFSSLPSPQGLADLPKKDILRHKVHSGSGSFPDWDSWTSDQKQIFRKYCGDLSRRFGYHL